jgi:hypothetical protein
VFNPRILLAANILHEFSIPFTKTVQGVLSANAKVEIEGATQQKGHSS